jgi:hypothetical protein
LNYERNDGLVLDDEDGMIGKTGALHEASPARLSAIAEDCRLFKEWRLVSSRRSILKTRNKRDDRRYEGQARLAKAGSVLRGSVKHTHLRKRRTNLC